MVKNKKGVSLKIFALIVALASILISVSMIISVAYLAQTNHRVRESTLEYITWKDTALDLKVGSDELTNEVRAFVVTDEKVYMDKYFFEADSQRREEAVATIKKYLDGTPVYIHLEKSLKASIELMNIEYHSMRLMVDVIGLDITSPDIREEVRSYVLTDEEKALDLDSKHNRAINLVFNDTYSEYKNTIVTGVQEAVSTIDNLMERNIIDASNFMQKTVLVQQILTIISILFTIGLLFLLYFHVLKPIENAVKALSEGHDVRIKGIKEYRVFGETYNKIRAERNLHEEKLIYLAEHDRLTGLFNRSGYDKVYNNISLDGTIFALVDVDKFKEVNDRYGHATGDKVLKQVSKLLMDTFKGEREYIFRIGGDEFAVIAEKDEENIDTFIDKCRKLNETLSNTKKEAKISLSIGIAIGNDFDTTDTLFKKADKAMYVTKENGRAGLSVYKENK